MDLPTEIHHAIVEELDFEDMVSFSVSNTYCWDLTRPHIDKHYAAIVNGWIGEESICVADCPEDPLAFLRNLIQKERRHREIGEIAHSSGASSIKLQFRPKIRCRELRADGLLPNGLRMLIDKGFSLPTGRVLQEMRTVLDPKSSEFLPTGGQLWVMRDAETKSYIICHGVVISPGYKRLSCSAPVQRIQSRSPQDRNPYDWIVPWREGPFYAHLFTWPNYTDITTAETHNVEAAREAPWLNWSAKPRRIMEKKYRDMSNLQPKLGGEYSFWIDIII
jgi:hypothetical protein